MRLRIALLLYSGSVAMFSACRAEPLRPARWEVGYWYWSHSSRDPGPVPSAVTPDVVYVQVGTLSAAGLADSRWPTRLPPARFYVATWRSDEARPPDASLGVPLAARFVRIEEDAALAGQHVVGLQLDVDCPTRSLAVYAAFLRDLRGRIPSGQRLSITALLDWFGRGTAVPELVASVDEYVPQFYDARLGGPGAEIAEPIDARRWAPVFNGLGTPYRIGLSAFGRIQRVRSRTDGSVAREPFRDVKLLELWSQGLRVVHTETNRSSEQVVRWDVPRSLPPALAAGDGVEAVLPTRESVRSGNAAARLFGGLCAGVVFFRWPGADETLVMSPDEVAESVTGVAKGAAPPRIQAFDGRCVGRHCVDLIARLDNRFPPRPLELQLVSSSDVEYLVPSQPAVTVRQTGAREIVVGIPAFVGEREVRLGRVFSRLPSQYQMAGGRP
jgi:hypothetical protein